MTRLAIFGAALVLAALAIWHPAPRAATISTARETHTRPQTAPVSLAVVYVAGAVVRPGLYRLHAGARADDAVRMAGGLRGDADAVRVNLAERVSDGEEVAVPKIGEVAPARRSRRPAAAVKRRGRRAAAALSPAVQPVDLNAADEGQLEQLPGVGPALAQRIVAYRNLNGPFVSLDELADVAGMTDRRVQEVAPFLILH